VRRRLFNLAAGVSLVLCVATVVLWVRSYWREDTVLCLYSTSYWDYPVDFKLTSRRGGMVFGSEGVTVAMLRSVEAKPQPVKGAAA
jgi:hypothetical protein